MSIADLEPVKKVRKALKDAGLDDTVIELDEPMENAAQAAAAAKGYATATDLADYLVRRNVPFRDAHEVVGKAVSRAIEKSCDLSELSLAELQEFNPMIEEDVFPAMTLEGSVNARAHIGGTSPKRVLEALAAAKNMIAEPA